MNDKSNNTNIENPIIRRIAYSAITTIANKKIQNKPIKKEIINADLIPKLNEEEIKKRHSNETIKKEIKPKINPLQKIPPNNIPQKIISNPTDQKNIIQQKEFGKLDHLIKDRLVTQINCPGISKNISVLRTGIKQVTNLTLSKEEIISLINTISKKTNIPYLGGNFSAVADNFFITVTEQDNELKFVIKKQTPYSLIETQN